MTALLYVQASPQTERSHSVAVADAFAQAYRDNHPGDEVVTLNVFQMPLFPFDGPVLRAKYAVLRGGSPTGDEAVAWRQVEQMIDQFKSADRYLFAVPMWNFGIPYRLKQYVDILVQPGYTFGVTEQGGFEGLVLGKPAAVVYARGGEYPPGTDAAAFDHQKSYFELILGFMGFTDIRSIVVEPTLMQGPEVAGQRRAAAIDEARRIAADF